MILAKEKFFAFYEALSIDRGRKVLIQPLMYLARRLALIILVV